VEPLRLPERVDLARELVRLGLTLSEARSYVSLLELERATAAEVATHAGVPRAKVYDALRALEERGFCSAATTGRAAAYTPVPAAVALSRWTQQREHERRLAADEDERIAARLLARLPAGAPPSPGEDYLESIAGPARTSEALERLIGAARRTVHMIQQPPFLQPRSRWNVAEAAAVRRGVEVRVLYTRAAVADRSRYRALAGAGGAVRVADSVPMKLLVRDGVEAMLSLRNPQTGEQGLTSVVIHHPDLVGPLQLLFDREWEAAAPLDHEEET
jgi:sugar-specific transcriptional regulator TrmB